MVNPARRCAICGVDLTGRHPKTLYCGATCRKRASRQVDAPATIPVPPALDTATLAARELEAAGRLQTAKGIAAVALAARIDRAAVSSEPGSSMAAMVKEFRATLDAALEGSAAVLSPADELRQRREARLRAVGS